MATVTSADGTAIGYDAAGSGPTLILVDGATVHRTPGSTNPMVAGLSDRFTVVSYDRRGRGESTDNSAGAAAAAGAETGTDAAGGAETGTDAAVGAAAAVAREIEDIDALITAVGAPAFAFGMSSGGMLLLRAAAALGPERIAGIALYEPPLMPEAARDGARAYTADLTSALADGRRGDAAALFLRRVGMPDSAIDGMRHSPAWAGLEALAPTLAYDDAAMGDSSVPGEVVARVRIPVLTVAGESSPAFLQYGARELAAAIPGATFQVAEGQTHDLDPATAAEHLLAFFPRP